MRILRGDSEFRKAVLSKEENSEMSARPIHTAVLAVVVNAAGEVRQSMLHGDRASASAEALSVDLAAGEVAMVCVPVAISKRTLETIEGNA
jgi:hypothetical protein